MAVVQQLGSKEVIDLATVDHIIDKYENRRGVLIQVLLDTQREYHWLPEPALRRISERLNVPLPAIYQVATFYKALSLKPRGEHLISVCLGTACHVRGGVNIVDRLSQFLDIGPGETTTDRQFTLRTVNCLGCCALGPVMVVDDEYHGKLAVSDVDGIIEQYRRTPVPGTGLS